MGLSSPNVLPPVRIIMDERHARTAVLGCVLLLAPISNLFAEDRLQILRRSPEPAFSPAQEEGLHALNARARVPFQARRGAPAGRLLLLQDGRLANASPDADEAARRFLAEHADLLGFDASWQVTVARRGGGRRAHLSLRLGDIEILGASAIVLQDGGEITGAALCLPQGRAVLGAFRLSASDALARAREEVNLLRRRRGATVHVDWLEPRVRRAYLATDAGLVPCYLVEERSHALAEAYGLFIDARDGALLRVICLIQHGTGQYPHIDQPGGFIPFATGAGEGKVYRSLKAARAGNATQLTLKNLSLGVPSPADVTKGFVVSARADTWDAYGQDPFSAKLKFNYGPFSLAGYDHFDQVNVMYQVEKFHQHVRKAIDQDLATDFSLPIVCNIASASPNAFFSSSTFPMDEHTSGFIAFFDLTQLLLDPAADVARDPAVVAHEYTHAWLYFEGLSFTGDLDEPSRAVNEGVADFFALTWLKDTVIGRYLDDQFPGLGISRDLQDADHFPETTIAAMAVSQTGLPEEHRNGEVFGSFLVDVRKKVGSARTERILYDSFPFWPHEMADVGYPQVTPENALAATETFFTSCVQGMLGLPPGIPLGVDEAGAIIGAAAGRGFCNTPASTTLFMTNLESAPERQVKHPSRVVVAGAQQRFAFYAQQGRSLSVTLAGKRNSGLRPDFTLAAISGNPAGVVESAAKVYTDQGRVVRQEGLLLQEPGLGAYKLTVEGTDGTTGPYTLTIDA